MVGLSAEDGGKGGCVPVDSVVELNWQTKRVGIISILGQSDCLVFHHPPPLTGAWAKCFVNCYVCFGWWLAAQRLRWHICADNSGCRSAGVFLKRHLYSAAICVCLWFSGSVLLLCDFTSASDITPNNWRRLDLPQLCPTVILTV